MQLEVGDIIRLKRHNQGVEASHRCLRVCKLEEDKLYFRAEFLIFDEFAQRWQKNLRLSFKPDIEKIA